MIVLPVDSKLRLYGVFLLAATQPGSREESLITVESDYMIMHWYGLFYFFFCLFVCFFIDKRENNHRHL